MKETRIVIAGGGFAGLHAARYFDKLLGRRPDIEVVLISRENFLRVCHRHRHRHPDDIGFLSQNLKKFLDAARKRPELAGLTTTCLPTVPQIFVKVDRDCRFRKRRLRRASRRQAIFGLSLLFVFLILAALYESWSLPFSVLLGTPVAVFGAFATLYLRGMENNVYAQIGLIMLIGLAAKNAILIVKFAKAEYEKSNPLIDAVPEGARLRLRPILMTSFAFIFGCLPFWFASGSGAECSRNRHVLFSKSGAA
jgi:AcrB/AcrD/AcrF family protein